ncbi:hypothetical protein ACIA8K_18550 [Catenuloplanes sp. NPDC051500]|uniref:hypothetical protein n=1 Tax=Catenuloplanes sp. NPDC051500 TaxID=3363959 RepID=UPI00379BBF48
MSRFAPVPLPSGRPELITAEVRAWLTAPPLRELVAAFGGDLPDAGVETWLDDFSARHWDFRRAGNVERDQVRPPDFDHLTAATVRAAATALGLATARPPSRGHYDHVLILGGLGRACLQRVAYTAALFEAGLTAGQVAALGSFRPLSGAERAEPGLADATHEVDAMEVAVRAAFGVARQPEVECEDGVFGHDSWAVRTFGGAPEVHVLAAPSSDPERRRAHTPDTYDFWARRFRVDAGQHVLVVTSPIYVPFQHCDAIRMLGLPYGCVVETIGFDPVRAVPPQPPAASGTDRYLQEIRSAVLSMGRLLNAG